MRKHFRLQVNGAAVALFGDVEDLFDSQFLESPDLLVALDHETVEDERMGHPFQVELNEQTDAQTIYRDLL